jgi:hypothetical protein
MHVKFWLESLKGRDHSEDLIILNEILGKYGWRAWFGFIWLEIVTSGGLL